MLNYVSLRVSDLERSGAFYDALLGPLGWRRQTDSDGVVSWGLVKGVFYITGLDGPPAADFGHVSFPANSIPAVKAAFESGTSHGGRGKDEPGSPPKHGRGNYSARMLDPDGHLIEVSVAPQ
jgi:catechol 2,3-dioxygenase-like lactoylglutathione lyase family enzyme